MNRNCDIIMFSLPRWDQPISSPALSLAKEFAKHQRVFYIEHPYSLKDVYTLRNRDDVKRRKQALYKRKNIYERPDGFPPNLLNVIPPITLPVNPLPAGALYNFLSRFNDKAVFNTIRKVIKDHHVKEWIYINSYDPFFARKFPGDLKPLLKVYQSMDDISQEPYTAKHGVRLEEDIVRRFDMTLATSKELTRLKAQWNPNSFFHPNAADVTLFKKAAEQILEKPEEMKGIDKKIIGFTGSIEYRTDFELVKKMVEYHKDKFFLFVGPVFAEEVSSMGFDKMPNVKFTGSKKITELPNYLQYMDCVIIPYKLNTLTKSIYPLKINEYLGAGKPVVATHFSDDIYSFHDVAYIAENYDGFCQLIDKAIAENSDDKKAARIKRAEQNTWVARVEQFWEYVGEWERRKK